MCGIGGILLAKDLEKNIDMYVPNLQAMVKSLKERGPDEQNIYLDKDRFGVVHTRLSIQDPMAPGSRQPVKRSGKILSFNGEIYNHMELRRSHLKKEEFSSISDTETLIRLIVKYGVIDTVKLLDGIFAFSLYDKIEKKLYLVRDHVGAKPLYYWKDPHFGKLQWGSYPSVIVNSTSRIWKMNSRALQSCMLFGAPFGGQTLFEGIESIKKATVLTFNAFLQSEEYKYYEPTYTNITPTEALRNYIPKQNMSDVPITMFLSGGIDSSLLATMINCDVAYHLESSETPYANKIAEITDTKLEIVRPGDEDLYKLYSDYSKKTGQINISSIISQIVASAVSQRNYKVGYAGHGADELFFGYDRIDRQAWNKGAKTREEHILDHIYHKFRDCRIFKDYNSLPSVNYKQKLLPAWAVEYSFNVKCSDNLADDASQRYLDLSTYTEYDLLNVLDHASMLFGVEMRVPFLSPTLINSALSRNSEYHCNPYGSKSVLKHELLQAGANKHFIDRQKKGFSLNKFQLKPLFKKVASEMDQLPEEIGINVERWKELIITDSTYLNEVSKAIIAFKAWKESWIDSGKVSVN